MLFKQTEDGLKVIDKTSLGWKIQSMMYGIQSASTISVAIYDYEIGASQVKRIERQCSVYFRKWLTLSKNISNTAMYGKKEQLTLPIPSIFEKDKAGKTQAIMML